MYLYTNIDGRISKMATVLNLGHIYDKCIQVIPFERLIFKQIGKVVDTIIVLCTLPYRFNIGHVMWIMLFYVYEKYMMI